MLTNPSPVLTAIAADRPPAGEYVPHRDLWQGTVTSIATGSVFLDYFTADKTESISTITAYTGSTAAGATPTVCRMAAFSVAANGDLTQVAVTPNDTTLFGSTFTQYAKAFSAPFTKQQGQRYALGLLVVTGAAAPNFIGLPYVNATIVSNMLNDTPALTARLAGQTDMPSSIAVGSLLATAARIGFRIS